MIPVFKVVLFVLAALVIVATALPFLRQPYWWVRMFDFPRAQVAILGIVVLALFGVVNLYLASDASRAEWVTFALLVLAVGYQCVRMVRYTPLSSQQTVAADPAVVSGDRSVRLVVSNVLMENREIDRWARIVLAEDPDVIATVETDQWWADHLSETLDDYPHSVLIPQDDTYGMCVFSKLPITQQEVRHLVEEVVPSLFLTLELPSGEPLRLTVLHPRPPRPDIQQDSQLRDAELVRAAREVATFDEPTIVAGDLNDVAWSYTTNLFQKLSGLLDPRIGRGLYSTFHAEHWWLRYPLDHVFHSDDLALVELRRLESIGGDHFPMMIELAVDPSSRSLQEKPDADAEALDQAEEIVDEAQEFKAEETPAERQERIEEDV